MCGVLNPVALENALRQKVFRRGRFRLRQCHEYLYHYTNEAGLRGILSSDRIHATSAEFSTDQEELRYGCAKFSTLSENQLTSRAVSEFTKVVFRAIQLELNEAIRYTFLACFCEQADSLSLWSLYGGYALRFRVDSTAGLALSVPYGFVSELMPAVYDRDEQASVLKGILSDVVDVLEDRAIIHGDFGQWAPAVAKMVAFNVAIFLSTFLVPLKNPGFQDEREWRFVVTPKHRPLTSDITEGVRNCQHAIKNSPKPHIEVSGRVPAMSSIFEPWVLPHLPVDAIRIGPCKDRSERDRIARAILVANNLDRVQLLASQIPTELECK